MQEPVMLAKENYLSPTR